MDLDHCRTFNHNIPNIDGSGIVTAEDSCILLTNIQGPQNVYANLPFKKVSKLNFFKYNPLYIILRMKRVLNSESNDINLYIPIFRDFLVIANFVRKTRKNWNITLCQVDCVEINQFSVASVKLLSQAS